jgi:hypothetical protein
VRENARILGDLARDFNFDQAPRPPMILPQHEVAPIPGKVSGDYVIGTIEPGSSQQLIKLQVSSTGKNDVFLLGRQILVDIPPDLPIYFGGRIVSNRKLAVGDPVIAVIVNEGTGHWLAREIDDLKR